MTPSTPISDWGHAGGARGEAVAAVLMTTDLLAVNVLYSPSQYDTIQGAINDAWEGCAS